MTTPIHFFDSQRIPLPQAAKGLQNQKVMGITAVVLLVLGTLGVLLGASAIAGGSFGMAIGAFPMGGLIALGVCLTIASIASISLGIHFLKRPYWEDQTYVDAQAEKAKGMTFDQIVKTFGWGRIQTQHIISFSALKEKFLQRIAAIDYRMVIQQYGHLIQTKAFIQWKDLKEKLKNEAENMTASGFNQVYGNQPLEKGVIDPTDNWYQGMILAEISRENLSLMQILTRFGWIIFEYKVIQGSHFRELFLREVQDQPLERILNQYSWKILDYGVVKPLDLHPLALKACEEIKNLEEFLNQFSTRIFYSKILTSQDQIVKDRVKSLCQRNAFSHLMEHYYLFLKECELLPFDPEIPLVRRWREATQLHAKINKEAVWNFQKTERDAKEARDASQAIAKKTWEQDVKHLEELIENRERLLKGLETRIREEHCRHREARNSFSPTMNLFNPLTHQMEIHVNPGYRSQLESENRRHRDQLQHLELMIYEEKNAYLKEKGNYQKREIDSRGFYEKTKKEQDRIYQQAVACAKRLEQEAIDRARDAYHNTLREVDEEFRRSEMGAITH